MQKALITIIGEYQSKAIQNNFIVPTLSTICNTIHQSNKVNKNLSVISLELILSFLLSISFGTETNSFTLKLHTPILNPKLK